MRRPWVLLGLMLTACQPQASVHVTPSASPAAQPTDFIYVQDPNGPRMLELDWSGKVHGSVSAQGFSTPSPDGSRFLRATDHLTVEDWRGHTLGQLDGDPSSYGLATWADDGRHLCGIVFPPASGPDTGAGTLWIGAPGEKGRMVGPVGTAGSTPAVEACSTKNNRAIVASGLEPHWPPGGTRYLVTAEIQLINLTTGAIEYARKYPLGNLGGQLETGTRGDWVLVAASPDARYVAESGVFDGRTTIREVPTGKELASLPGNVGGFSSDGTRVVASVEIAGSWETRVISWADQGLIWHGSGVAQSVQARPDSSDLLIGRSVGDSNNLVVVRGDGTSAVVVQNGLIWSPQTGWWPAGLSRPRDA